MTHFPPDNLSENTALGENAVIAECIDCNFQEHFTTTLSACPHCGGQWLEARYDYARLKSQLPDMLKKRPFNLWRYAELLPVRDNVFDLSLGEGGSPLIHAKNLGMMLGLPNIYIKDERQGPTASFKDRQAAVGVAALKDAGIREAVLASTGNVAISYSAYAARAGVKLWAFLTSLVPPAKMREVALYGTQVIKVTGSYDQAKKLAAEFAQQRGLYLEKGSRSIPSVEGIKTIAYEIAEQVTALSRSSSQDSNGNQKKPSMIGPDWYFQAVSGGLGPFSVQKGFKEMVEMGWLERMPAMASIQVEGCAPMVDAWKKGLETADPVLSPRTHIATLSTGDPGRTYTLLSQRIKTEGGGAFESVTDEEAFRAMHILAKMEGISVEPATAVAFAGLIKLAREGTIHPDEVIVVNCSGHTMPIEKTILGEGWFRNLVLPQPTGEKSVEFPQEGLLAALNRVTSDRYSSVLIVDDTPDARRLIRRILQSQGNYTLFEAENGMQALELAHREIPDLIILDLMMAEMDGFGVLDRLKSSPETAPIPVIVVTAKELTQDEKARLKGQIHSLMQKGEFMSDELLDEVRALLQ